LLTSLKNAFYKLSSRSSFYKKNQQYKIHYCMSLTNLLNTNNAVEVLLPLPLETSYQKITTSPTLLPDSGIINEDRKCKNTYAYWNTELKPQEEKTFSMQCEVGVFPRSSTIESQHNKLLDINAYVIKNLEYGNPIEGLYILDDVLKNKKVDCGGFDVLFIELCKKAGIPARIISGFWAGYKENGMHAWVEIQLSSGEWIAADPSIEQLYSQGRTKKYAKLGFVGSDRIALSIGTDIPIQLKNKTVNVAILQNPLVFSEKGEESFRVKKEFKTNVLQ